MSVTSLPALPTFARRFPDKPATISGSTGEVVTFGELDSESLHLARYFTARGLQPGDVVALLLKNTPGYLTVSWGAERSGLVFVPVNWHLGPAEAAYIVSNSGAKALIASAGLASLAEAVLAANPQLDIALAVDGEIPGFDNYEAALNSVVAGVDSHERQGAYMFYSSGTTGSPKGIMPAVPDAPFGAGLPIESLLKAQFGMGEDTVYLSLGPLYHSAPQGWSLGTQSHGGTTVIVDSFDAEQTLALIEQYRVTHVQVVPTMFVRMLKLPQEVRDRYDLSSLRLVFHAAAPCPPDVKERMIEWLGPRVIEFYSASEFNSLFVIDSASWLTHRGSVGRAVVGTPHILDDDGNELPVGEVGEVWIENGNRFEYHGEPAKTAAAYNDRGWSTLGDLGSLDAEGYLYLSDRRTDLIISGGVNIYPREIEDTLVLHEAISDVAVLGIPDDEMGQQVKAVVQLAPGLVAGASMESEIIDYCLARLAKFKCPRSVDFVAELPRLPSGKLLRRNLADRYAENESSR